MQNDHHICVEAASEKARCCDAGSQELGHARSRSVGSAGSLHARLQGSDPDSLPLHWRQAVEDSDVPGCALFDHPCPVGPPPGARWGHASAAVGDRLYMFGGDGATMYSNGFVYDSGKPLSHAQLQGLQTTPVMHPHNDWH